MQKEFCVYIWVDPKSDIPRYVGKGLLDRPSKHLAPSADTRISRLLKKRLREGYEVTPYVMPVKSEDEAFELEILFIATFGRLDRGEGPLFNKTDGGDGVSGHQFSEESKLKMKEAQEKYWADSVKREQQSEKRKKYFDKPGTREANGIASSARYNDPVYREREKLKRGKPCTIDGVTIFPSRTALLKELGYGKDGVSSPSFRYLEQTSRYQRKTK